MNKLKKLAVVLGLFALALFATAETTKPNFLVIFTDDQTYRAIGYNNPEVKTPQLDQLAKEGLIFNNAYVASPICAASRASMMSGTFPQEHGVIALNKKGFESYLAGGAKSQRTLPNRLREAGYHTAFWGKSHLGPPEGLGFHEGKECGPYDDTETFRQAEEFLSRAAKDSKPFFLWLAPRQPHVPLLPKQEWLDLYDETTFEMDPNFREEPLKESAFDQGYPGKAVYRDSDYTRNWRELSAGPPRDEKTIRQFIKAYYATISHLDHQIGSLVTRLSELGLDDNTVIIFLSDNGYHLGNHGLGNKITMHEESVRVPMFIHWSGLKERGQVTNALVSSLDIYPTLLELAGIGLPDHLLGKSLMPILSDPKAKVRDYVFSECVGVKGGFGEGHRMARGDQWKYVLTMADEELLFDESNDPYELENLVNSPEHAPTVKQMRQELAQWMKSNNDRSPPFVP